MANSIFHAYSKWDTLEPPSCGILASVRGSFRNQVLVDEATDFSVIQLAIMYEMAHPTLKSFFACGDFNQRLTQWGVQTEAELDWVTPRLERRTITVAYRQSGKLVELAKEVAAIGGATPSTTVLPDRLDSDGLSPVWAAGLDTDEATAAWLADRIREVERNLGQLPSIAVLVNDEPRVVSLATALSEKLASLNLKASACRDGEIIGNEGDVRVFNVQHIKGMEFEAVFFIGLDEVMATNPDIFSKYLYVGATRAATYLGVTFKSGIPCLLRPLGSRFTSSWGR